ncbi:hypothetical protein RJ639_016060 [Escallonia herrerae]|uniref:DUF4378 domain-containing protein n=1 Tax=Escallonia herrerae TaxID=1293975 RepID=A0AA88VB61_9ASTE|nr:hypothetical protein RJ639_016060 [Escallonia herrerae]
MALLESDVLGSRPKKSLQKPLLLKDFLLDDLNSCSSSGFRSYPRRQCCTSVRFLLEIDLTARNESQTRRKNLLHKSRPKTAQSTTMSVLQRASEAVINAVKYFPFAGLNPKKAILPRSFSRKISKRSFWKKKDHHKEIKRWKSFRELLEEQPEPLSISPSAAPTATAAAVTAANSSSSESSNSDGKSDSWSDSEFTSSDYNLQCGSSGNSEVTLSENDVVDSRNRLPEKVVRERVGVIVGEGSTDVTTNYSEENTKGRNGKELKKQLDAGVKGVAEFKHCFSRGVRLTTPDVPEGPETLINIDDDDDHEVSSPFRRCLSRAEGTASKQKLIRKARRFENLSQLQPVDLESRIAQSECDHKPVVDNARQTERKAVELLKEMKATIPPASFTKYNPDKLLLHFFGEGIAEGYTEPELVSSAKDWINGHAQELLLEWEEQKNREAYMEKGRKWEEVGEEKQEVASELEAEIFTCLVNELLLDLFTA